MVKIMVCVCLKDMFLGRLKAKNWFHKSGSQPVSRFTTETHPRIWTSFPKTNISQTSSDTSSVSFEMLLLLLCKMMLCSEQPPSALSTRLPVARSAPGSHWPLSGQDELSGPSLHPRLRRSVLPWHEKIPQRHLHLWWVQKCLSCHQGETFSYLYALHVFLVFLTDALSLSLYLTLSHTLSPSLFLSKPSLGFFTN